MSVQDARLATTARYLAEEGLDGLVALNGGQNSFLESHAVFALSGVRPIGESAVLVDRTGASTLIVTPAWEAERAAVLSRTGKTVGTDDLAPALASALAAHKIDPRRTVTVALSTLGLGLVAGIEAVLGGKVRANDKYVRELARIRSPEELAAAQKATWIAERGYERFLEFARPGLREFELAAELYGFMKGLGAEDNFLLLCAGPHNRAVQPSTGRKLEQGDIILAEITPSVCGQLTQICRTVVLGEPPEMLSRKYELVVQAMNAGIAAARPGVPMGQVCGAINAVLEAQGYGEYCHPPHIRRRGHGLGFASTRPGDVSLDNATMLEPDMLFMIHPNQYLPETGYLLCGEPVVITPGGADVLTAERSALGVAGRWKE